MSNLYGSNIEARGEVCGWVPGNGNRATRKQRCLGDQYLVTSYPLWVTYRKCYHKMSCDSAHNGPHYKLNARVDTPSKDIVAKA
jgi:hypothetical protein